MTAPIKTCDYCGATGEMPTFMNGETICYTCLHVLPKTLPEARQELMRLQALLAVVAQPAPSVPSVEVELWRQNVLALVKQYGNERATEAYHGELHCRKAPKDVCTEIEKALDAAPKQEAQPAPSVPDGWLRAIDEALVTTHIGVANAHDTYEQAKAMLDNLIEFHVDVATDPAVNGGYKLMPIEPTQEIYECFSAYDGTSYSNPFDFDDFRVDYGFALEAAPEAKP